MEECYITIENYNDYEISNLGNCRNKKSGKILKPRNSKCGYLMYSLSYTDGNKRKQKNNYQHRLLAQYFLSNPNNLPFIDHIDRNKLNNSLENLRWISQSNNLRNALHKNTSGHRGVTFNKPTNKWRAQISIDNKCNVLGSFVDIEDAINCYTNYIKEHNLEEFIPI